MSKNEKIVTERELPEVLQHDFVICDNTVNRYRWRLLVAGIDLTGFLKNPVCCVQHDTRSISIGKWKKLWVDGEELKGTLEFDRNDPDAVRLYWKYKDGYMSAVSLNVIPIEESDDEALLLPGQKYSTITKSELLEISTVTIPGQKNAVKLSTPEGAEYKLNLITTTQKQTPSNMEEDEKNEVQDLKDQLQQQKQLNAENLIKIHKQRNVVSDGEVEHLQKLALSDYESVSKMLEARPTPTQKTDEKQETETSTEAEAKQLSAQMQNFAQGLGGQQQPVNERAGWKFLDYFKKDPISLEELKQKEPEKYKKLEADFYAESEKMGIKTTEEE